MATANFLIGPDFSNYVVGLALEGKDLRLGIILDGDDVSPTIHYTASNDAIAAEYAAGGWLRPTISFSTSGAWDAPNLEFDVPTVSWDVIGPTGGFSIKQFFIIIDGSTTPGNTTGTFAGLSTFTTPIAVADGETTQIDCALSIFAEV
jgi:hypothetical protein